MIAIGYQNRKIQLRYSGITRHPLTPPENIMSKRCGRPRGTKLTDRLSVRVTAVQKQRIEQFCSDADLLQKEFVLMAIDSYIAIAA
jgi:hypothetical protein